jgi:hypothetical protein
MSPIWHLAFLKKTSAGTGEEPYLRLYARRYSALRDSGSNYLLPTRTLPIGVTLSLVAFGLIEMKRHRTKLAKLVASRSGGSICEFARAFDRHAVDTWVVRAVYEQLQDYLGDQYRVPIRASDTFGADLPIDLEDLEMDIVPEIAQRTGPIHGPCGSKSLPW